MISNWPFKSHTILMKFGVLALMAGLTSPFGHVMAAEKAPRAPAQPEKSKPLWELGFVAAGGLGREFRLQMSYLHYDDVALLLICYLALVIGVDLVSAGLRRLAR